MKAAEVFKRLGFGKHTAHAYETLLASKKPMLLSHLAKAMKVARAQAYRNVEELMSAGFVKSTPSGKRTLYLARSPRLVSAAFRKAGQDAERTLEQHAKKREREAPHHIRFFSGFTGIRAVFDDVVAHTPRGETFYRYTSERDLANVNRYLSASYRTLRDKKKLERLVISNPVSGRQKRARLERFIKYIQPETALFDQNIIQLIYGSRIAFINLNTEEAFVIEDGSLASFQKVIFNQLYRKL